MSSHKISFYFLLFSCTFFFLNLQWIIVLEDNKNKFRKSFILTFLFKIFPEIYILLFFYSLIYLVFFFLHLLKIIILKSDTFIIKSAKPFFFYRCWTLFRKLSLSFFKIIIITVIITADSYIKKWFLKTNIKNHFFKVAVDIKNQITLFSMVSFHWQMWEWQAQIVIFKSWW